MQGDLEDACGEGLRVSELQVVMPELGMKRACHTATLPHCHTTSVLFSDERLAFDG